MTTQIIDDFVCFGIKISDLSTANFYEADLSEWDMTMDSASCTPPPCPNI